MPVNLGSFITSIKSGSGEVVSLSEGSIWEHVGWDNRSGCSSSTYDRQNSFFCVPSGYVRAKFEVWGGGGGGGPARCCAIGIPGNAGAYARKCIAVTAGSCYGVCTSACSGYCTTSTRGQDGTPGCVCGTGLTNFWANGGCGGLEWCFAHANACFVGNVVWNRDSNVTGNIVCTTWGPGADTGCFGLPGFIERVAAGAGADDYCAFRFGNPYAAFKHGLTGKGGWSFTGVRDNHHGYADSEYDRATSGPFCMGGGPSWAYNMLGWSGTGSPGGAAKAGNCYAGGSYSPARIRVTYT